MILCYARSVGETCGDKVWREVTQLEKIIHEPYVGPEP